VHDPPSLVSLWMLPRVAFAPSLTCSPILSLSALFFFCRGPQKEETTFLGLQPLLSLPPATTHPDFKGKPGGMSGWGSPQVTSLPPRITSSSQTGLSFLLRSFSCLPGPRMNPTSVLAPCPFEVHATNNFSFVGHCRHDLTRDAPSFFRVGFRLTASPSSNVLDRAE